MVESLLILYTNIKTDILSTRDSIPPFESRRESGDSRNSASRLVKSVIWRSNAF